MSDKPASEGSKRRRFTGLPAMVIRWITVLFALYSLAYIGGLFEYLDVFIFPQRHDAVFFMFVLVATYLYFPATKGAPRHRVPWYDIVAIVLAVAVNLYVVINALEITLRPYRPPTLLEQAFGIIDVILILEGVRRTVGLSLSIIGFIFFLYPFVTPYMPGFLQGRGQSFARMMEMLYVFPTGIYGGLLHLLSNTIVVFMLFGAFLHVSGAGNFLVELAYATMGRFRGGPAKVSVLASCLFGMVNGSPVANVAAIGVITIPMMKRVGYEPHFAGAIEAAASSGGQIMPPVLGVAAFLMMEFLGVSYATLIGAALLPALLYYAALFIMIDLEAVKTGLKGTPASQLPSIKKPLMEGGIYFIPLIILVALLVNGFSAESACLYATISLVVMLAFFKKLRMGWKKISDALFQGMNTIPELGTVLTMSGILLAAMDVTGVGVRLTGGLVEIAGGSMLVLLLVTGFAALVLGTGLPGSAVYVLCAILLVPAMVKSGMIPLVAHFFVFYYGVAAVLTPPVCLTAFVAAGIAGAPMMKTGWTAMRLGIVAFIVPFMFAYGPQLLMIGTPVEIAVAFITALIGVYLLSCSVEGFLMRRAGWVERVLLFAGGMLMIAPNVYTSLGGLALGALVFLWQYSGRKRTAIAGQ